MAGSPRFFAGVAHGLADHSERTPWGSEWYAIDDDIYDGAPDSKMNIAGVGATEAEAIEDLKIGLEQIDVQH